MRSCRSLSPFQSTPPRGGRLNPCSHRINFLAVSIHAPTRGATLSLVSIGTPKVAFQSTPPRGGRLGLGGAGLLRRAFQSTPPRGGRRREFRNCPGQYLFQSTPPRGGRREMGTVLRGLQVCFNPRPHAGGDLLIGQAGGRMAVSIHAPTRGATWNGCFFIPCDDGFNPRPHAGGDLDDLATQYALTAFQSTPPRGGRQVEPCIKAGTSAFQYTPPRGGRL